MLKKMCIWLGGRIGYLLYTLIVLAVFLWLLFPEASLHRLIVRALNNISPDVTWQMDSAVLRMPGHLVLETIAGYDADEAQQPLVRIDALWLKPDMGASLRTGTMQADYHLRLAGGTVTGTLILEDEGAVQLAGTVGNVQLGEIEALVRSLQRAMEGVLSGSFSGRVRTQGLNIEEMRGTLRLETGRMALNRAILKHQWLPFDRVEMELVTGRTPSESRAGKLSLSFSAVSLPGKQKSVVPWKRASWIFGVLCSPGPGFSARWTMPFCWRPSATGSGTGNCRFCSPEKQVTPVFIFMNFPCFSKHWNRSCKRLWSTSLVAWRSSPSLCTPE
jgi:type II secretion system protein N